MREEVTEGDSQPRKILESRSALILLLAILSGIGAVVLSMLARRSGFEAALVGFGAWALAVKFFDWLIRD